MGVCICPPAGLIFLCFFLTVVLSSVAAFAGAIMGTVADAIANVASVRSRMADLFMHFPR